MNRTEQSQSPVYRQLEAYEESWKNEHEALQECWNGEDTIAVGITTGELLERTNNAWRERVFRGVQPYHEEANNFVRSLFELWLRVTESLLGYAERLETTYDFVAGIQELRALAKRFRECLANWQPPRISSAVGLRETTLTPVAARELDRILAEPSKAKESGSPAIREMSAEELRQLLRKS